MEQDVGQIGAPRSAQMRMGKSVDRRVVVVIARTGVPVVRPRIGAELHHAERSCGAGIGVAVESGPDEGIDVFERIGRAGTGGARKRCKCQNQGSHHGRSDGLEFRVYKYTQGRRRNQRRFPLLHPHFTQTFRRRNPAPRKIADKKADRTASFLQKKLSLTHKRAPKWHALSF